MNDMRKKPKVVVVRHNSQKLKTAAGTKESRTDVFHKVSTKIATKLGSPWAFYSALVAIVIWAASGPFFHFSNTWQLLINTGTTTITFLMVFVIQNTQNRDGRAMQLKLDELIKASHGARIDFVDIEDLTDAELDELQEQFHALHEKIKSNSKRA